jgi:O-antigen/teichoic acid export membrane protein
MNLLRSPGCSFVSLRSLTPGSFIHNLATTALASVLTLVSAILTVRILAQGLGPDQFGAYSLARRLLTITASISMLSMGVAIPRYVAIAKDDLARDRYLLSGLILGIVPGVIILVGGLLLDEPLASLFFRNAEFRVLLDATLWLVVGYSIFSMLYAFYRGMSWMGRANLWQVAVVALGPLLVAWVLAREGRADLVIALSAAFMWFAAVPIGYHVVSILGQSGRHLSLREPLRQLLIYGFPRVPADLALGALFAVGPFLAPYTGSLRDAGYFAAGQSVLIAFEAGVGAFGLVVLPKLARMVRDGSRESVAKVIELIITLVLHIGLFATLQGLLWADVIVWVLLGPQYQAAIPLMRVILVTLMPYLAYVMLRSVVDAIEVRAVNTMNLFLALLVTLGASVLVITTNAGTLGLAVSMGIGLFTLGGFTILYFAREYRPRVKALSLGAVLLLNLGFLAVAVLIRIELQVVFEGTAFLLSMIVTMTCLTILYAVALRRLRVSWMLELEQRVLMR